MKYTVFISDTHFSEQYPEITQRFIDFLDLNKTSIERLYLLGDLFNAWIGDDDTSELSRNISQTLLSCAKVGVGIYFIHGNRDYLLGEKFARSCGMTLLNEQTVISLYGKIALLMHGDLLCTDDHAYQKYRRIMFSPIMKKISLILPLWLRKRIAKKLRETSQESNRSKSINIMDVCKETVFTALEKSNAELLIHGHTHRQAIHTVQTEKILAQRMVLGAWETNLGNAIITSAKEPPRLINFDQAPRL